MTRFLPDTLVDQSEVLPKMGSWPATVHVFEAETIHAMNAALAAQRPLLVRGEPGTGKSQLARAAAHVLNRAFICEVVHARSESQDLQWIFDAVGRLGEAQTLGRLPQAQIQAQLDPLKFLSPGALWWAFDPKRAEEQYQTCQHNQRKPTGPVDHGSVLLIDEIDKADADLPNGLLETLGNGAFSVPYLDDPIGLADGIEAPLVIITTNEERELPSAFVRRCMVLHLALPTDDTELQGWLKAKGEAHFGKACSDAVRDKAAELLLWDRKAAVKQGVNPPGQAEYLDMLRAVVAMTTATDDKAREQEQQAILAKISQFALKKFSGLSGS